MSQDIKSSRVVRTVINWIGQSEKEQRDVPISQARHWREALLTVIEALEAREIACLIAEDDPVNPAHGDRFSAVEAEFMLGSAGVLIRDLAVTAAKGSPSKAADIDRMAVALIDLFESLARGVARPDIQFETPKGA